MLLAVVATLAAVGIAAWLYIRTYCDYIWDDLIMIWRVGLFLKIIQPLIKANGGIYNPAKRLEDHAREIPNKAFLLFEDQKFSFAETNAKANQVAHALESLGVSREQKAAILMKNKPELLFVLYGCIKLAVPLSLLNTNIRRKSLIHCIKAASTKNFIVDSDPEMLAALEDITRELAEENIRVFVYGECAGHTNLADVVAGSSSNNVDHGIRKDIQKSDVVTYLFTSGTTGLPKAAKSTYGRWAMTAALGHIAGIKPDDVMYAPLPLYHTSSLLCFHSVALLGGQTYAFAGKFSATRFWTDCNKHGATVTQYIGETGRYLLAKPPSPSDKRHNVRLAIGNGLRADIWDEFKTRFNIDNIGEFYGSTEGNVLFVNVSNKLGSCGRRSPLKFGKPSKYLFLDYDTENEVVRRSADGYCKVVPLGTPGLLAGELTDITRFEGYADEEQSKSKILKNVLVEGDAYFNTGDIMLRDTDYHVYFVDRIGDTFRWKGENVATQEVATLLNDLDLVMDCAVYGVPVSGTEGNCGMAAIVLRSGITPTADVLRSIFEHCKQVLPSYARPIFIRFMQELYLTETYKHQKFKLKREGFNIETVSDVYVQNTQSSTYTALDSDVYDTIMKGGMNV